MRNVEDLILYRSYLEDPLFLDLCELADPERGTDACDAQAHTAKEREIFFRAIGTLIEMAVDYGFSGNLWQYYLTDVLVNDENAYSISREIRKEVGGSLNEIALHDLRIFRELFTFDLSELGTRLGTGQDAVIADFQNGSARRVRYHDDIRERIAALSSELSQAEDLAAFKNALDAFYAQYGVGKFGLNKAFRPLRGEDGVLSILPIPNIPDVSLEDLVGYDRAKEKLCANTEAFLKGAPANNCLLYGDAGTGKSSSIKGILNRYYDQGLRMIEVTKYDFRDLNDIISLIKTRNYRFILYMDDLSFENEETEYKYLKALIEGGLEKKPENVLIYATSNRRHLVRENYTDKEDRYQDMHTSDTVQEKLSLASRFGLQIYYGIPNRSEYEQIVLAIAEREGIKADPEELLYLANAWEVAHGNFSGRTARQFIDDYLSKRS